MYIRRTQTRNTTSGERYYSHRLVQSERVDGKVRQRTLLNLGRHFEVAQEDWPLLCSRIEAILSAQSELLSEPLPPLIERQAQRIAAQLLARQGEVAEVGAGGAAAGSSTSAQGDIQSVDVDSLSLLRPRTVGVEQMALWAMAQVQFVELLEAQGLNGSQRSAVLGNLIGRMAAPGSELATHRWLQERSGLGELLEVDFEAMGLSALYRASDRLLSRRSALESALFERVSDLFGLSATVTLYDLTNTYLEGEMADNELAQRGHSKEKRSDCPLVTLGLVLDGSGFVRRSQVFEGNVSEGKTLKDMLEGLDTPEGALVVMDRGIATEANLAWLRQQGYRYLVVSRERHRQFDPDNAVTLESASGDTLQLDRQLSEDGQEVRLYCTSEKRREKEKAIDERFRKRFENELDKMAAGLKKPRTTKRLDRLWERIGRLKEKSRGVGQHYEIELIPDERKRNAVALKYRYTPKSSAQRHPGVYCLRSSETDWSEEKLWRTYIMLTDLEAVFRSLKSELGLRPVYHHSARRVKGHLFITVLAYQFVQIIRRQLKDHGIHERWQTLRQSLSAQVRVTASFKRADGRTLHVRKATQPEGLHRQISQALHLDTQPGGIIKTLH